MCYKSDVHRMILRGDPAECFYCERPLISCTNEKESTRVIDLDYYELVASPASLDWRFFRCGPTKYGVESPLYEQVLAALPGWEFGEVEHVFPKSRGGGNGLGNLVLSCSGCNWAKSNEMLESGWLL